MASTTKMYGSSAEIQDYFIKNIAPNYFDFENTNNYRAGLFGYINEIMSIVTMDTHNAINTARREFYPVSAKNQRSFYKMASVQQIGLPLTTPARCNAVLLLDEDEVIANSKVKNGVHTCVIDNTIQISADILTFSILYPIVIISNKVNGKWTHTIHYDKSTSNDLDVDPNNSNYISNRVIYRDGKHYLLISVNLYQCKREEITETVTTDSSIQTVSLEYEFDGNLSNFEVFYTEDPDQSTPIHLIKLMEGQAMVKVPFCYYRLLGDNKLEITFPRNIVFTPELNSEVTVVFYTSEGEGGNFPEFKGDLVCNMDSETYPYNNNMTVIGVVNGSSEHGKDAPDLDQYKEIVKAAYATNNTITTENDLQHLFDLRSTTNNKIVFKKKRADAFDRLYGAYVLLKDDQNNVVPSNTLTLKMKLHQFDSYSDVTSKAVIKPGMLFEYDDNNESEIYTGKKSIDLEMKDDLSEYDSSTSRFIYTNPFLIMATLNPNLVGYYINSMDETRGITHSYMNDESIMQFIGKNFRIQRNAIEGEDFYKLSIMVSPTQELNSEDCIIIPDKDNDEDYYIRAEMDGEVVNIVYDDILGTVVANIKYIDDSTEAIQIGSYVNKEPDEGSDEDDSYNDGFFYHTGYHLLLKAHDTFIEGDVLATRKVVDKGKLRACVDLENLLFANGLYIPLVIEEYDEDNNIYTFVGYISTDDTLDNNDRLLIGNGIYGTTGMEDTDISLPYKELRASVSMFYKNDISNLEHKYSNYEYFHYHTMTNTYTEDSEDGIYFIKFIDFVRSTLTFSTSKTEEKSETDEEVDDEIAEDILPSEESTEDLYEDILITLKEVPLIKANWLKDPNNYAYLINTMTHNYMTLREMYFDLENNYSFDLKFYNSYGRSKFFKVGIRKEWLPLSRVNCSFKFGVYLNAVASKALFLQDFREYVKNAIESINSMNQSQQSIFIMNLIRSIQNRFSEIGYIEYYGFNDFNESVQKIQPVLTTEMSEYLIKNYIPEFINVASHLEEGISVPDIDVEFLNDEE